MNEELQKLKEEFEQRIRELEDKYNPEEEWPKEGDEYWVIDGFGDVNNFFWRDDPVDNIALKNNAIFKTKEEAEFETERLKVLRELEKLGRPFVLNESNWSLFLNGEHELEVHSNRHYNEKYGSYYFDTEEQLNKAIDKIGEDRIKKYLFGVNEGDSE